VVVKTLVGLKEDAKARSTDSTISANRRCARSRADREQYRAGMPPHAREAP